MKINEDAIVTFLLEDFMGRKLKFTPADTEAILDKIEECRYLDPPDEGKIRFGSDTIQTVLKKENHPDKGKIYIFSILFGERVAYTRESSIRPVAIYRCVADYWKDVKIQKMINKTKQ